MNDIPAFEVAGVSVAVADAVDEVKSRADIVTDSFGGHGAVREVVTMILEAKNLDPLEVWLSVKDKTVGMQ